MTYHIRIQGHLDPAWQTWLSDMQIAHQADGTTLLSGELPDQAALFGLLQKLFRLGIPLLTLESSKPLPSNCYKENTDDTTTETIHDQHPPTAA